MADWFPETTKFFFGDDEAPKPSHHLPARDAASDGGGALHLDVKSLSIRELRRSISDAGLGHSDCLERSELEARFEEARSREYTGPCPSPDGARAVEIAGLRCCVLGSPNPELVVVIYHGYYAPASELVPLAQVLEARLHEGGHAVQFVLPQCGESAWFNLDFSSYVMAVLQGEAEKARVVRATPGGVEEMRASQSSFVAALRERTGLPTSALCLCGFSQGAMVALDVALHLDETCAGVVVLSGFVMAVERWAERLASRHRGIRVLQLHGLQDNTIPFYTANWLCDLLKTNGARVMFIPHSGGHEFGPPHVFSSLLSFLTSLVPSAPMS